MEVLFNNKCLLTLQLPSSCREIKQELFASTGLHHSDYYLLVNGKLVSENDVLESNCTVHVVSRLNGGKGGFGSMLRAIGAQIEKTTNREACRDLSGRRLRDINEEQRLKNWIAAQAEREKEAAERKKKKLERLCQLPKHEFKDEEYDKERSELPQKVVDAVEQGLKVAGTSVAVKRKQETTSVKKKKPKLWVDDEIEDELSSTDEEKESEDSGGSSPNVQDEKVENCQVENKQDEKNILEKESTKETAENGCKNDNVLSETSKKDEKE